MTIQLELDNFKNSELYQQAKEDNKLEIAPRLLQKGLSVDEVAELLELDVHLLAGYPIAFSIEIFIEQILFL